MPTSSLVQRFFFSHKQKPEQPAPPAGKPAPDLLQKQVEEVGAAGNCMGWHAAPALRRPPGSPALAGL